MFRIYLTKWQQLLKWKKISSEILILYLILKVRFVQLLECSWLSLFGIKDALENSMQSCNSITYVQRLKTDMWK